MLAVLLHENGYLSEDIDYKRLLELVLLHDIGESVIGDVTPASRVPAKKKAGMERDAVGKVLDNVPGLDTLKNDLASLVSDQGDQMTDPVHELVKQIDKLDMMIQALLYEREYGTDLSDFHGYPEKYLVNEQLLAFFESVKLALG